MGFLASLLPIGEDKFEVWAPKWISSIYGDLSSIVEDDNDAIKRRNERFGAYLPTVSTLISIYRIRSREARDRFYRENPKPEKGIKEWEERRDAQTSKLRYMHEWLVTLREDIQKRISVSQTNLGVYRTEVQTFGQSTH